MFFHPNPRYQWKPQKDITAYELAMCMGVLTEYKDSPFTLHALINSLPVECQRHFQLVQEESHDDED